MSLVLDWIRTTEGEDPMTYLNIVFRYAMTRTRNREDAEDIAIEVVQALPNPCYRRDLRFYMIGIARRKVVDRLRRSRPTAVFREQDASERFDARIDDAALIEQTMDRLSAIHRETLALKYVAGLTSEEVGRTLKRSPEAIDSLMQRARAAFSHEWTLLTSEEEKQ